MFESFRAYQTTKAHEYGRGWCLHIIDENQNISVQKRWFKDLMTMFAFMLAYPEGQYGTDIILDLNYNLTPEDGKEL